MKALDRERWTILPLAISLLLFTGLILASCTGPQGPTGPTGATGASGPSGPPGDVAATYVGSATCAACHNTIADLAAKSGHAYKLNKVTGGQPPRYPFTSVLNPPEGYSWNDITYVIGGYGWKARFIDKDGYIITGKDGNATTQYNLANSIIGKSAGWVGYKAGQKQVKYNCGPCHTTGYEPTGNQDNLPGLVGTWAETGVRCEECHGPGSNHVKNPYGVAMKVDRSAEACGVCHSRSAVEAIDATGGFIEHHEQYEELFQSKHRALNCVACHNPHQGVIQARNTGSATTRVECQSCHFLEAKFQKSEVMKAAVKCIDCHMPRIVKSAWGNAAAYTGDIRVHTFAIDPYAMSQFSADGKTAISQISLDFACKFCHRSGGSASVKTDDELKAAAIGYHSRP